MGMDVFVFSGKGEEFNWGLKRYVFGLSHFLLGCPRKFVKG